MTQKNCIFAGAKTFKTIKMKQLLLILTLLSLAASPLRAQGNGDHHRLTNLPHLYIETFSGADVTSKTTEVPARLWMVDEQDDVTYYDSINIRGRGNSTWKLQKKPYRIKFASKQRFLGADRANAKKWTLLANHGDKSLMRNALASYIGDLCGQPFTPGAMFVDLTLNGQYRGNYQASDQIDVRKRRVNIAEQDYPLTAGSDITGGYIVEADGFADFQDGKTGWRTAIKRVPMAIHYPSDDEISTSQLNYIRNFVNTFESRLLNSGFESAQSYHHLVDTLSLVSWYLASELTANPDYVWSMYFYKERGDDRLHFGPMWDYDIAFDNDSRLSNNQAQRRQLMADIGFVNNGLELWVRRMWQDEWFQRLVFDHYKTLYEDGLEQKLISRIDSLATLLEASQQLNYERWNIRQRTLREVVIFSTYDEYVDDLRAFIHVRVPALLTAFAQRHPDHPDPEDYITMEPDVRTRDNYLYTIANAGTGTVVDTDAGGLVVANHRDADSHSQQWLIHTLSNGYHHITNRLSGLALTDPTQGASTATTNLSTQLCVAQPDSADRAQQWHLVLQAGGRVNLTNRQTDHTANLTGGRSDDGTTILSYTNDARNASSNNRLWMLTVVDSLANDSQGIAQTPDLDYALAYDPIAGRLHFGADDLALLQFSAQVYDAAGRPQLRFRAQDGASVAHLPRGLYIVAWQWQGRRHTAKFMVGQ